MLCVCQGEIILPVLFTVYFDELLKNLKHEEIECHVSKCFVGALRYADKFITFGSVTTPRGYSRHLIQGLQAPGQHGQGATPSA